MTLHRNLPLVVFLSVLAAAASAQNNPGTGFVVELGTSSTTSGQFQGFTYNSQTLGPPAFSATGPAGASQFIPKPDGSKFFVVGAGGVFDFTPAFGLPSVVNGIAGTPSQASMSPDGELLLIASNLGGGSSNVYLLNTTTDTVVMTQSVSGSVIGMAASRDSTTLWILESEPAGMFFTIVDLTARQQVGNPVPLMNAITGNSLGGGATAMTFSPLGLLYVSAANAILEIDPANLPTCQSAPRTCSPATVIPLNATPGPVQFSTDGSVAYFINGTPQIGGQSLFSMALPSHTIAAYQSTETFDSIVVAGPNRLFAHSPGDTTLWDVAVNFSSVNVSALKTVLAATDVLGIAVSNELPLARYLYAQVGGPQAGLYRVDLTTNLLDGQATVESGLGAMQFASVPPEINPAGFITYNTVQVLSPGATALPLIARVLDLSGRPVFALPVTFTGDPSLTFSSATAVSNEAVSNEDGYVQTTVTLGQNPGLYPVTLTAGSGGNAVTTTFSLTIPGTGTVTQTPPPVTTGSAQIIIVAGNGEFIRSGQPSGVPLTVQVLQASGSPMANVAVTFTVTGPSLGQLGTPNAITDANGFASTTFTPPGLPSGEAIDFAFESTTVTASASVGSVNFVETVFQEERNGAAPPVISLTAPASGSITVGEGGVVPNGIVASISTTFGGLQPVPNVGIRLASINDSTQPGPAACQGSSLSDASGMAHCNVLAACPAPLGLNQINVVVGEYFITTVGLDVVLGASRAITIKSGNNQSGSTGATLTFPLVATITDGCGTVVQGVAVTWAVTQGAATLKNPLAASDSNGNVSTFVVLGQTPGVVTVTATIGGVAPIVFTIAATSTVTSITAGGIVPVGSTVSTIAPGEWVSIYGFNLAGGTATWTGNFPTMLGGTSVTIDGNAAYLSFVSPTQINLQAPNDSVTGPVPVVVTSAAGTAASTVTLAPFAPSFLLLDSKHVAGIILRSNGAGAYGGGTYDILGPTGSSLGYATVAAKAGDTVELFAVGLGPTNPVVPPGQAFFSSAPTTSPVNLLIGNVSVTPAFAGLSSAGVYQINLTVPPSLGAGDLPLVATVGGAQTPSSVVISLQGSTVGSVKLISGGGQTALVNQAFSSPLVFQITDTNNNPVAGVSVTFSVSGGAASVSASSAVTNAQGQAAVSVTAGNTAGGVTINATYATFTASASLTVVVPSPLSLTASSFTNSASGQPGLVPCGLATVIGAGLAPGISGVVEGGSLGLGPSPYTLQGVSITVSGIPAPLESVSNQGGVQQVNFQTPCEIVPGAVATVMVQVGTATTVVTGVNVYPAQPGIFTFAGPGGISYAYVSSAATGAYVTSTNFAHAGQAYYMVVTGLGQTTPAATTNAPGTGLQTIPITDVVLAIGNIGVPVTSVVYQQGESGDYVVSFTIPATANGAAFPTGTNLPMQLGVIVNSQTFYDNSQVVFPGIQ